MRAIDKIEIETKNCYFKISDLLQIYTTIRKNHQIEFQYRKYANFIQFLWPRLS
jgi:hypothetical protein